MFIARDRLGIFLPLGSGDVLSPLPRGDVLSNAARRDKHSAPPERASVFSHVVVVHGAGFEPAALYLEVRCSAD